jgi:hypothetical protein
MIYKSSFGQTSGAYVSGGYSAANEFTGLIA